MQRSVSGRQGAPLRLQAAVEYITLYGLAIIIIIVAVGVLYTLLHAAQHVPTNNCQISSGVACTDMVIATNALTSNTQIILFLANSGTSALINPKAIASIGSVNSTSYVCMPSYVKEGGAMVCVINLTQKTTTQQIISGNLYLKAGYCGLASTSACQNVPTETFSGQFIGYSQISNYAGAAGITVSLSAQATSEPLNTKDLLTAQILLAGTPIPGATVNFTLNRTGITLNKQYNNTNSKGLSENYVSSKTAGTVKVYANFSNTISSFVVITFGSLSSSLMYVPITLRNTQSIATGSPFQQMISFSPSTYSTYEASDLGNLRFYAGASNTVANELYSWCESGCNTSAANAVFWVRLNSAIAANSNTIINMTFQPTSTEYGGSGTYAGESPEASVTGDSTVSHLPSTTGSTQLTAAESPASIYYGSYEPQSADSGEGVGYVNISATDDGNANVYICTAAIYGENGADSDGLGPYWSWVDNSGAGQLEGEYINIGTQSQGNPNCQMEYQDRGRDNAVISVIGIASAAAGEGEWLSGSNDSYQTGSFSGTYTENFTPLVSNELDVISYACGNAPCGGVDILNLSGGASPLGTSCSEATGTTVINESTGIYTCYNLTQGDEYQADVSSIYLPAEVGIEMDQFVPSGTITTDDPYGYQNYVCTLAVGGSNPSSSPNTFGLTVDDGADAIGLSGADNYCNSEFEGGNAAMTEIGVEGYISNSTFTSSSGYLEYSVTAPNTIAIIGIACQFTCSSGIQVPSGCVQKQDAQYDSNEESIMYLCSDQAVGSDVFQLGCYSECSYPLEMAAYTFWNSTSTAAGYAKYDNGNKVFNFYDNFTGTSLRGFWDFWTGSSSGTIVDNGITFIGGAQAGMYASSSYNALLNTVDAYDYYTNPSIFGGDYMGFNNEGSSPYLAVLNSGNGASGQGYVIYEDEGGGCSSTISGGSNSNYNIFTMMANTIALAGMLQYASTQKLSGGCYDKPTTNLYLFFYHSGFDSGSLNAYWIRVRTTPPNMAMPTVTFGNVMSYGGASTTTTIGTTTSTSTSSTSTSSTSSTSAASTTVTTTLYYVPITLSNTRSTGTASSFQQMISFSPTTYSSYETSSLGNIRFYAGTANTAANELYSWCESGCSTSPSGNAIFWVKLTSSIGSNSNTIINMTFLPNSIGYDGVYGGEAPELTCTNTNTIICSGTYGQYDNGNSIFPFYDNFAGMSLDSNWANTYNSGAETYFVDNGLRLQKTTAAASGFGTETATTIASGAPAIAEADMVGYTASGGQPEPDIGLATSTSSIGTSTPGGFCDEYVIGLKTISSGYGEYAAPCSGSNIFATSSTPSYAGPNGNVLSLIWVSSSNEIFSYGYTTNYQESSTEVTPSSLYGVITEAGGAQSVSANFTWFRIRIYPPNDVMPAAAYGNVI